MKTVSSLKRKAIALANNQIKLVKNDFQNEPRVEVKEEPMDEDDDNNQFLESSIECEAMVAIDIKKELDD